MLSAGKVNNTTVIQEGCTVTAAEGYSFNGKPTAENADVAFENGAYTIRNITDAPVTLTVNLSSGEEEYVAKVGDTFYQSVQAAFDAAAQVSGGGTVTLLRDVTVEQQITLSSGTVTLDGGGHTLTGSDLGSNTGTIRVSGTGNLTVEYVTVKSTNSTASAGILVNTFGSDSSSPRLTVAGTARIEAENIGISSQDSRGTLIVRGTVTARTAILISSGDVTIEGGAQITSTGFYAIEQPSASTATLTVNGGQFEGPVQIQCGTCTLNGGTFTNPNGSAISVFNISIPGRTLQILLDGSKTIYRVDGDTKTPLTAEELDKNTTGPGTFTVGCAHQNLGPLSAAQTAGSDVVPVTAVCGDCHETVTLGTLTLGGNNQTITFGEDFQPLSVTLAGFEPYGYGPYSYAWESDTKERHRSKELTDGYTPTFLRAGTSTCVCTISLENRTSGDKLGDVTVNFQLTTNPADISKAEITLDSSAVTTVPYDGAEHGIYSYQVTVTVNGKEPTASPDVKIGDSVRQINAGSYPIQVSFSDRNPYSPLTGEREIGTFTITPATPTISWKNPWETQTYHAQGPHFDDSFWTVTLPVIGDTNQGTVTYSYATTRDGPYTPGLPVNVGTYYVRAHLSEQQNYTAAVTDVPLELKILKVIPRVTAPAAKALTYDGTAQALVTAGSTDIGVPVVYALSQDGPWSETIPTATDAGDYTVWYQVEGMDNYEAVDPDSVQASIDQALVTSPGVQDLYIQNNAERTYTFDLNAFIPAPPAGQHYGPGSSDTLTYETTDVLVNDTNYFEKADVTLRDDGVLSIPVKAANSATQNPVAMIGVSVTSQNFQGFNIPLWVYATDKESVTITGVTAAGWTYDGTAHNGYTGTPSAGEYPGELEYSYSGQILGGGVYNDSVPPTEAGYYTVTISVPDGAADYIGSTKLSFTVEPAAITIRVDDKSARVGEAMPELTYTVSGLAGTDELTAEPALTCDADMGTPGSYPITVSGGAAPAGYNYNSEIVYQPGTLTVTANPVTPPVDPDPPVDPNPPSDLRTAVEVKAGITEVPEGLRSLPELNTPEKLERAMRALITQAGVPGGNTAVYDVTLMISTDGGRTWTPATRENFPSGGLTVTLPYPAGTDSSYTFTVVHMFTTSDFGKTPGETETPAVTNTAEGLQFTVTGLSPISVGWRRTGGGSGGSSGGSRRPAAPSGGQTASGNKEQLCSGGADCPSRGFTDLGGPGTWYHEAVDYVLQNGLMNGYSDGTFRPGSALTRAQFAQILYNQAGRPAAAGEAPFLDVVPGAWCAPAIAWAAERGIVGGYGDGRFGPDDGISREQLAVMLWRYAGTRLVG